MGKRDRARVDAAERGAFRVSHAARQAGATAHRVHATPCGAFGSGSALERVKRILRLRLARHLLAHSHGFRFFARLVPHLLRRHLRLRLRQLLAAVPWHTQCQWPTAYCTALAAHESRLFSHFRCADHDRKPRRRCGRQQQRALSAFVWQATVLTVVWRYAPPRAGWCATPHLSHSPSANRRVATPRVQSTRCSRASR